MPPAPLRRTLEVLDRVAESWGVAMSVTGEGAALATAGAVTDSNAVTAMTAVNTSNTVIPTPRRGIPDATVARLPVYHRVLANLAERGVNLVSSEELAAASGVTSAKLRKDLSYLGSYGTRGVGYEVEYLIYQIARELGLTQDWPVVIVGVGNLGQALAGYGGFASRGFRVVGLLDSDPARTGQQIPAGSAQVWIRPMADLEAVVRGTGATIGVIATPAGAAQTVCDRLVAAGVTSILNFAPTVLQVAAGIGMRKVDLAVELQILAFHEQRKASSPVAAVSPTAAIA